jgi:hypothetical protein
LEVQLFALSGAFLRRKGPGKSSCVLSGGGPAWRSRVAGSELEDCPADYHRCE